MLLGPAAAPETRPVLTFRLPGAEAAEMRDRAQARLMPGL
jgi:hypothetical protein